MSTLSKDRQEALTRYNRDRRLYQITIINADGTRRRGPILRAIERDGYIAAHDRLADVTGTLIESHEVFISDPPAGAFAIVLVSPDGHPLAICHERLSYDAADWHASGHNSRPVTGAARNIQLIIRQVDLTDFRGLPTWFEYMVSVASAQGGGL